MNPAILGVSAFHLRMLLCDAGLDKSHLVKDVTLNLSDGGKFSFFAWSDVPDCFECFSACGDTFDQALANFKEKAPARIGAAEKLRAEAHKLLEQAARIDAGEVTT